MQTDLVQSDGVKNFLLLASIGSATGLTWKQTLTLFQLLSEASSMFREDDIFSIETVEKNSQYAFSFPIRPARCPELREVREMGAKSSLVFTTTPSRARALLQNKEWVLLASGDDTHLFQLRAREAVRTLAEGLNPSDVTRICQLIRAHAAVFVGGMTAETNEIWRSAYESFPHLRDVAGAAISIWVDGELRGSAVNEGSHFITGISSALNSALRDRRFKFVSVQELERADIEISRIGRLSLPKTLSHRISHQKGYKFLSRSGEMGWYLPGVFNVREFSSQKVFFETLALQKANVRLSQGKVRQYIVDGWLSSLRALTPLRGGGERVDPTSLDSLEAVETVARSLVEWLSENVYEDGSFSQSLHPNTGRGRGSDLGRTAFVLLALTEYQAVFPNPEVVVLMEKIEMFLRSALQDKETKRVNPMAGVYLARALFSKDRTFARELTIEALRSFGEHPDDLILGAHTVFLVEAFPDLVLYEKHPAQKLYEHNREKDGLKRRNPAMLAEIVPALKRFYPEVSQNILSTLRERQHEDGSFPGDTENSLPYTRGTAKVFEVLAQEEDLWEAHARPALAWILSLQIRDTTAHWIVPELRRKSLGGIREDAFSQLLWIDGAAHVIMGCARRGAILKAHV